MSDVVIKAVNLGKSYTILPGSSSGLAKRRTLQEDLINVIKNPLGSRKQKKEEIWALRDVNFEIKKGEVVGVIGANGAGKSTLLKILSRITEPTTGHVDMYGRVGSLLEVGTGFHSELSGRENIYLNGAVLGMRKKEIDRKFDEIVDFSGVEKYLDTPVKRYSSGMRVRLAFSVAAHLEPEILIIDEVLSVGDAEFRKKSLGKMDEVARAGRTVLFVSHNMGAIRSLCSRAFLIQKGRIIREGNTNDIVNHHLIDSGMKESGKSISDKIKFLPEDPDFKLNGVRVSQNDISNLKLFSNSKSIEVDIDFEIKREVKDLRIYIDLIDDQQNLLIRTFHNDRISGRPFFKPGTYKTRAIFPSNLLAPLNYNLVIRSSIFNVRSCIGKGVAIKLNISNVTEVNLSYPKEPFRAKISPEIVWEILK